MSCLACFHVYIFIIFCHLKDVFLCFWWHLGSPSTRGKILADAAEVTPARRSQEKGSPKGIGDMWCSICLIPQARGIWTCVYNVCKYSTCVLYLWCIYVQLLKCIGNCTLSNKHERSLLNMITEYDYSTWLRIIAVHWTFLSSILQYVLDLPLHVFLRFSRYICKSQRCKGGWQPKIASTEARVLVSVFETGRSLSSRFIGPH